MRRFCKFDTDKIINVFANSTAGKHFMMQNFINSLILFMLHKLRLRFDEFCDLININVIRGS